jgi:hypothetical protein
MKETSSAKFFLAMTLYFILSTVVLMFTSDGWGFIASFFYSYYFYFPIWILLSLTCAVSRRVRYSILLICFALPIQMISVMFNPLVIVDAPMDECMKRNFIQRFFDASCDGAWMDLSNWNTITLLYAAWMVIFTVNTLWARFISREVR